MSFISILDDVGNGLKKFFVGTEKVVVEGTVLAKEAEPLVAVVAPGVSVLFNSIVDASLLAEGAAKAAGAQAGTGPQKLAAVTASIEGSIQTYLTTNGITEPLSAQQTENLVNAAVLFINNLPPAPAKAS